jgi:hypothetical protein
MLVPRSRLARVVCGAIAPIALTVALLPAARAHARATGPATPVLAGAVAAPPVAPSLAVDGEELQGRSGKLLARFVAPTPRLELRYLARLFGDSAGRLPGAMITRSDAVGGRPFNLITLLPFSRKVGGRIGSYRMGFWPAERGRRRSDAYANPDGFIRVTPDNQVTYISEHFRLADFLTKDQRSVWPKYLVLREDLVDKLELVITELESQGVSVAHMQVMSGFRTPQYNQRGVGAGGRAQDSRHQYGDAADVFVDNDRDGRMDDLNGDGRVDSRDAAALVAAVERVERRYPDLVGGAGVYRATSVHGPFAHIDVRGRRARWGSA